MVTVGGTSAATANFGEQRQNSVSGVVFVDLNGNLLQDTNEQGLGGVSIALLSNGQIVTTTTTLENGTYAFTALAPGDYTIQETDPPGFVSSSPNIADVNVGGGSPATANFGDQPLGTVSGAVYLDLSQDGIPDANEPGIGNVTIALVSAANTVIATTTTGNGNYLFANVAPGTYTVRETQPAGYQSITPNSVTVTVGGTNAAVANFGEQAPTAITLVSLTATPGANGITIRWVTSSERGTQGFYLSRSVTGHRRDAVRLMPFRRAHGPQGGTYEWTDSDTQLGLTYTYWLIEVEQNGTETWCGAVAVRFALVDTFVRHTVLLPFVRR